MPEDLISIGAAGIAAYLTKDAIQRLLGPTADYIGEGLKNFVQKRSETVGKIFKNAQSKLGGKMDVPGTVPPKVLKMILNDASFSNDDLAVEYFGGILASSRTELGRDDRGAHMAKIVESLSTYQLRTHYLIYSTIRTLFSEKGLSINLKKERTKMQIFIPSSGYLSSMDFSQSEYNQIYSILPHIMFGMSRDEIINEFMIGSKENIAKIFPDVSEHGTILSPAAHGVEIFLWAFGHADKPLDYFFSPEFNPTITGIPAFIPGSCATDKKYWENSTK